MTNFSMRPLLASAAILITAMTGMAEAQSQSFPFRDHSPVWWLSNSPSTPPDIISRIIAKELSQNGRLARVIVENRPGGVSTIAANDVLGQPADAAFPLAMSVPSTAAQTLVPNISYHLDTDFEPVNQGIRFLQRAGGQSQSVPAHTVAELVASFEKASRTS